MTPPSNVTRRKFLRQSLTTAGVAAVAARVTADDSGPTSTAPPSELPSAMIGNVRISRLLLGGNLIGGWMHARDLKYVDSLFRAYATEEKMLETLRVAEQHGINTVFETGAEFVQKHNRLTGGNMQFIPHIRVEIGQSEDSLREHIQTQVDSGAAAVYVWGVSGDRLVRAGEIAQLAKAVELAKKHDLPVGVGSHSLKVPQVCEQHGIPCDFYVKTLHRDDYPSATPRPLRQDFMWLDGGAEGYYDNMWCIDVEETIEFMQTVTKPWLAFKVLAAGAYLPRDGFNFAFRNGADFIAVGMLDFQLKDNCELVTQVVRRTQHRPPPWGGKAGATAPRGGGQQWLPTSIPPLAASGTWCAPRRPVHSSRAPIRRR